MRYGLSPGRRIRGGSGFCLIYHISFTNGPGCDTLFSAAASQGRKDKEVGPLRYITGGLAAVNLLCALLAKRMGHGPRQILRMLWDGIRQALPVIRVLLVIGMVTGIWRAAGTITVSVYYGIRVISPRLFLLVAFLLACLMSYALGTSFGIAGTVGVIFMTLARSGGVDPAIAGGVLLSGVFFGDRGSPISSTANLVAGLTETDLMGNVRRMMRTGALPFALCLLVYGFLSFTHPIQIVDNTVIDAFRAEFQLSAWAFVPAVLMLLLPLLHIPILWCMGLSIASGVLIARFVQGAAWGAIVRSCLLGYTAGNDDLGAILNGGGMISMADSCVIVLLACACSGLFGGTGMLRPMERRITALVGRIGTFPVLILTSLLASAVFCNQVIAIVMGKQLLAPVYAAQGRSHEELAIDLENTAITVPAFVPWSIISSVPRQLLGVGYGSMLWAVFLYAVPLINLAGDRLRRRRQHIT